MPQVEIIGINFNGDGYGLLNGKKVFIPKTAIGDIVNFDIIKKNKDFITGKLIKLEKKSDDRIDNIVCSVFSKCGGCNLLHLKDEAYYKFKENILHNAIKKSGYNLEKINLIHISFNERRRATFQVQSNKLGFFEKNSNSIVEINSCPLILNEINKIIPQLKELIKKISLEEISVTSYENGLEILLTLKKDCGMNENLILKNFVEQNKNIMVLSYKIDNEKPFLFLQKSAPILTLNNGMELKLAPNIFLQATLEGQNAITNIVVTELKNCKHVLDLYSGIGTYTFPLSSHTKVHTVEGDKNMIDLINENIKSNNLNGKITTEVKNLVSSPLLKSELTKYDGVVINPPRNGAKAQCEILAKSGIKKIVMVSCNPQTFAIDANELRLGGYKLNSITGIDQFYRTQHLEIVAVFEKVKLN